MAYRAEREKQGFCLVWLRGKEKSFLLHRNEFDPITTARLKAIKGEGPELYDAEDLYGDPIQFDLRDFSVVALASPEAVADCDRETDEQKRYERDHE